MKGNEAIQDWWEAICRGGLALVLCLGLGSCTGSCAQSEPRSAVVFLEATPSSRVNEEILNEYLLPIYKRLVQSDKAIHLEVYAISGNTEAGTALLELDVPPGYKTEEEANAFASQFRSLQERYQRVYDGPEPSYLIDVLGTAIVLDGILGRSPAGETVHVIYLSDMIQQEELEGMADDRSDRYDFTNRGNALSLDDCRKDLEPKFSRFLLNRDRFQDVAVYVVPMGVDSMLQKGASQDGVTVEYRGPEASASNQDDIRTFWERDFFGNFLKARSVSYYQGGVGQALDAAGL